MDGLLAPAPLGAFAERLLAADLPALPAPRRRETVEFVAHRVATLPSFTRFGVRVLDRVFGVLVGLPAGFAVCTALARLPLPFVAEFPRLIRSLGFTYVWERWPDTTPDGAPGSTTPDGAPGSTTPDGAPGSTAPVGPAPDVSLVAR